jgi:FkbH-like protein
MTDCGPYDTNQCSADVKRLLTELAKQDVRLFVSDGALDYTATSGALSEELAGAIRTNQDACLAIVRNRPADAVHSFPLSCNQQSLWLTQQSALNRAAYNIGLAVKILSEIDRPALQRACDLLVGRHPLLRTTYGPASPDDTAVWQHVRKRGAPCFETIDCSGSLDQDLRRMVGLLYRRPFDFVNGPMVRFYVLTIQKTESVFLIVTHHIACDGWSFKTLLTDLGHVYCRETGGPLAPVVGPSKSYADFVGDQAAFLTSEEGLRQALFWQKKLSNLPKADDFTKGRGRPPFRDFEGSAVSSYFSGSEYACIMGQARSLRVTPMTFLLSLFQLCVMRASGGEETVTGIAASGTHRKQWDPVVGYFVNPIAVRAKAASNLSFREFCGLVHGEVLEGIRNQDYPFALLVDALDNPREPGSHPVFQTFFNLISRRMAGPALEFLYPYDNNVDAQWAGLTTRPFGLDQQTGNFDLNMEIGDTGSSLFVSLKYRTDIFREFEIHRLMHDYRAMTLFYSYSPDAPLSTFWSPHKRQIRKVLLTGTFTIEPMLPALAFWSDFWNWPIAVECIGFNQVFQQLLDPAGAFRKNTEGFNVCLVRFEDWMAVSGGSVSAARALDALKKNVDDFLDAAAVSSRTAGAFLIVMICKPAPTLLLNDEMGPALVSIEGSMLCRLSEIPGCRAFGWEETHERYPLDAYFEPMGEKLGHIPYTEPWFCIAGSMIARCIRPFLDRPRKVIAVDCDNTLWTGVLGEDGERGIIIDDGRRSIQRTLIECVGRGMLLCLCSKNDEKEVLEVVKNHPDMLLRPEHVAAHRINWGPKPKNIGDLSTTLNLDAESFIFIDDSPLECGEMSLALPQVLTVRLPRDSEGAARVLRHLWGLDGRPITAEDRERTTRYRQEAMRSEFRGSSADFTGFIEGLGLKVVIRTATMNDAQRVSQLSLRTNQFNVSTKRRNEAEVVDCMNDPDTACFAVDVSDRFGEYGLVGVCIARTEPPCLAIDSLMLSCRALGRGVEHRILSFIGTYAIEKGLSTVEVTYVPTPKNIPAKTFLSGNFQAFQRTSGEKIIFEIPSKQAKECIFKTMEAGGREDNSSGPNPEKTPPAVGRDDTWPLIEIAERLNDTQAIVEAIGRFELYRKKRIRSENTLNDGVGALSETQSQLAEMWREVIPAESVGAHENFFDAGGTSSQLPSIAIRIQRRLGVEVTLADLFQYTTISRLAGFIDSKELSAPARAGVSGAAENQRASLGSQRERLLAVRKRLKAGRNI